MRKTILLATKNPGKILEYKEIMKARPEWDFDLLTLDDVGINDEPEEDGKTFLENAIKKADFYSRLTELPVLAEDSGLEIDCLNGEPGVFSRRWPGHKATDEELVKMTLKKLQGVPRESRGAQFRVLITFKKDKDSESLTAEGILRGIIEEKPTVRIITGYPFRSLFYVPEIGKIIGDMTMKEEAHVAHRKQALEKLMPEIISILDIKSDFE